jgi:hypothetical protein
LLGSAPSPTPLFSNGQWYSDKAVKAKYQGSVLLITIIAPDGKCYEH